LGNLLCNGQDLCELVVGDIVEFCAVVLGDDELWRIGQKRIAKAKRAGKLTA
jgi:DNA-binding ferritin-like protein (Dps family)